MFSGNFIEVISSFLDVNIFTTLFSNSRDLGTNSLCSCKPFKDLSFKTPKACLLSYCYIQLQPIYPYNLGWKTQSSLLANTLYEMYFFINSQISKIVQKLTADQVLCNNILIYKSDSILLNDIITENLSLTQDMTLS